MWSWHDRWETGFGIAQFGDPALLILISLDAEPLSASVVINVLLAAIRAHADLRRRGPGIPP